MEIDQGGVMTGKIKWSIETGLPTDEKTVDQLQNQLVWPRTKEFHVPNLEVRLRSDRFFTYHDALRAMYKVLFEKNERRCIRGFFYKFEDTPRGVPIFEARIG